MMRRMDKDDDGLAGGPEMLLQQNNRRHVARAPILPCDEPDVNVFDFQVLGLTIDNVDQGLGGDGLAAISHRLSDAFQSFVMQLLQKAPQGAGHNDKRYCLIPLHEAYSKTNDWLKDKTNIKKTWHRYQYIQGELDSWNRAYLRLFSTGDVLPANHQGFKTMAYWNTWQKVCCGLLSENDVKIVREAGKKEFDKFAWVVESSSDKLYWTRVKGASYTKVDQNTAPKLSGYMTVILRLLVYPLYTTFISVGGGFVCQSLAIYDFQSTLVSPCVEINSLC